MSRTFVELIAEKNNLKAISVVKKALAKKLVEAISEQASDVARGAYGTLEEYFGGDEQPDYVNNDDNAYAVFFANALKKFGVNGPEDFKDDATKQRFFDYVDHNWRAQDSVQTPLQGANGGNLEVGTQTQLPPTAAQPQAPVAPTQGPAPTTAQGNDPSVATMASAGPTLDQISPLGQAGSDPSLNAVQNQGPQGSFTQTPPPADQYAGNPIQDVCPCCKGSGKAACPTCGRPHTMDQQQGMAPGMGQEMGQEDDFQPDLEIGGEEESQIGDDEEGLGMDDESEEVPEEDVPVAPKAASSEELDDPFDDEDAYTIDINDFNSPDGDGVGDVEGDKDGEEFGDEEGEDEFGTGDDSDEDDQYQGDDEEEGDVDADSDNIPDDTESDLDDDGIPDDQESDEDEDKLPDDADEDPDLNIGDEDEDSEDESDDDDEDEEKQKAPFEESLKPRSWSRKERKSDSKKPVRQAGKKAILKSMTEDFGFGMDDAEDAVFVAEAVMQAGADPGLQKLVDYVQTQLSKIKKLRNTMLMQLRRQRSVIKKDSVLNAQDKMDALKQLAQMAKDNRSFFKNQAKSVKDIFTGHLGGGEDAFASGDEEQDQDQQFPPQKPGKDPEIDGEEDSEDTRFPPAEDDEETDETDQTDDSKEAEAPEESDETEEEPEVPVKQKPPVKEMEQTHIPQAHSLKTVKSFKKLKEDELAEFSSSAAIEGNIKRLAMQIATQGDPGGKRRAALKKLEDQLKRR